ncbi:MAG: helix-turn-helix transcriptional regulator [Negativicutes bacterium]|nr:helix-turn-helix transcriptional regulator [Negativicutes bacterium]
MKRNLKQKNRVTGLREERGLTKRALAKMIGTSAPHMGRLESGETPLDLDWATKIAAALNVSVNDVIDLPIDRKITADCDDALLGSTIGWLLEASERMKVKLSRQDLSHWAGYVYKGAVEQSLNYRQTEFLAATIVKVIQRAEK